MQKNNSKLETKIRHILLHFSKQMHTYEYSFTHFADIYGIFLSYQALKQLPEQFTVLEAGSPRLRRWCLVRAPFPVHSQPSVRCPHMAEGVRELLWQGAENNANHEVHAARTLCCLIFPNFTSCRLIWLTLLALGTNQIYEHTLRTELVHKQGTYCTNR